MPNVIIASGQTKSGALDLGFNTIVCIAFPTMTGTAITFEASFDGSTFYPLNIGGSAYTEVVAASTIVRIEPSLFSAFRSVKIVSNATEGAERTLQVGLMPQFR